MKDSVDNIVQFFGTLDRRREGNKARDSFVIRRRDGSFSALLRGRGRSSERVRMGCLV